MFLGGALTEYAKVEKFFLWIIDNVNLVTIKDLKNVKCRSDFPKDFESPKLTATDPYTGIKYTGNIKLRFSTFPSNPVLVLECYPDVKSYEFRCQCDSNNELKLTGSNTITLKDVKRLVVSVDYIAKRTQPFQSTPLNAECEKLVDRLKKMWKNDSSTHFTIECGKSKITAIKPILAASSPVLKAMLETDMIESKGNCMQIKEFDAKVVEKMIEFCENDSIDNIEECEEELFKIAHKYQMIDLMKYSITKMADTISTSNIESRVQLANLYELKDFNKWCMQFAFRNNIEVDF